ncbi:MAG TPA: type II CAAX endopeptidase family protein [Thermoanaerobaculia bacterium]|nr:type II CAAX endopeptidase family protein [Thermoanaerobaculia bacterium]
MGRLDAQDGGDGVAASRFGASHAIIAYVLVVFGGNAAGMAMIFAKLFAAAIEKRDLSQEGAVSALMNEAMMPMVLVSMLTAAAITLAALRILGWPFVRDRSPNGFGFVMPPWRQTLLWFAVGVVAAGPYIALRLVIPTHWEGPMAKFLRGAPDARIVFAALALLYAPLFEELLFRGMMLRGMRASWGTTAAGIVVTILFFVLHLPETYGYWPAMLAIVIFSVVALCARLRTGSLVPAVAAHAGYNIVAVWTMFAFMQSR